jgi:hypothetical protein
MPLQRGFVVGRRIVSGFRKALESAAKDYSCSSLRILEHIVGVSSAILLWFELYTIIVGLLCRFVIARHMPTVIEVFDLAGAIKHWNPLLASLIQARSHPSPNKLKLNAGHGSSNTAVEAQLVARKFWSSLHPSISSPRGCLRLCWSPTCFYWRNYCYKHTNEDSPVVSSIQTSALQASPL